MTAKSPLHVAPGEEFDLTKDRERSGSGPRLSSYHEWLKVPPVSGFELVSVLEQIGFVLQPGSAGVATLQRYGDVIEVPLSDRLDPDVLIAILQRAGLTPSGLISLLGK
jgi:hypothetical protein